MPTFYVASNGCIRRKLEAQHVVNYMSENGHTQVFRVEEADYLLYFSCVACKLDEKKAVQAIGSMVKRSTADAKLILAGCLAQPVREYCRSLQGFHGVVPPRRLNDIDTMIPHVKIPLKSVPKPTRVTSVQRDDPDEKAPSTVSSDGGLDAFKETCDAIVISEGCLSACSYCCIHFSTGRLKSRTIPEIVYCCRKLYEGGSNRFFLTGEDTGAYGIDLGTDLLQLVRALNSIGSGIEMAVNSMNPRWLCSKADRIKRLLQGTGIIKHVHIPMQSASDRLLTAMNRGYTNKDLRRLFNVFYSFGGDCRVHTHLMVGFPGETNQDIEDTIRFIREYSDVHYGVFPYSERLGTVSSQSENRTPSAVIRDRVSRIRNVLAENTARSRD